MPQLRVICVILAFLPNLLDASEVVTEPLESAEATEATVTTEATATAPSAVASEGWARASRPSAKAGAGFVTVTNTSEHPRKLVGASADFCQRIELHTHSLTDGVMRMMQVEHIEIPANGTVAMAPGGNHLMFFGLEAPLKEGETRSVTLTFDDGTSQALALVVRSATAMGAHDEEATTTPAPAPAHDPHHGH